MNRSEEKMEPTFLDETTLLIVQQEKALEILTPIDQKNLYEVRSVFNATLGTVEEESGGAKGIIMRNINAASWRTFKFQVLTRDMKLLLRFERMAHHPWAVVKVFDPNGKYQGKVKRAFNPISKSYALHSRSGIVFGRIRSPLWRPWNFPLFNVNGRQTGAVQKKWRGLLEEFATNADNFKVDFPEKASASEKAVILAAAITIDFNHFERSA